MTYKLSRWAKREGKTVSWGNVIGPYLGQAFEETFATEDEAKERQRQAEACESIGDDRPPVPLKRTDLRGGQND